MLPLSVFLSFCLFFSHVLISSVTYFSICFLPKIYFTLLVLYYNFLFLFLDFLPSIHLSLSYFHSTALICILLLHIVLSLSTYPQFKCLGPPPSAAVLRTTSYTVYIVTRSDYLQWVSWGVWIFTMTSGRCRYHSTVCGHKVHMATGC
jgi:hypothetical protein